MAKMPWLAEKTQETYRKAIPIQSGWMTDTQTVSQTDLIGKSNLRDYF